MCIGPAAACVDKQQSAAVAAGALGAAITAEWDCSCTSASGRNEECVVSELAANAAGCLQALSHGEIRLRGIQSSASRSPSPASDPVPSSLICLVVQLQYIIVLVHLHT